MKSNVTTPMRQSSGNLDCAKRYAALGWSVIPIESGTKEPAVKSWKRYQRELPPDTKTQQWFANGKPASMAVICGEVSGGLVIRDFDDMDAYKRWADANPVLAETLPTVETGRPGRHVYARIDARQAAKLNGKMIVHFDDGQGELRAGGYCLLPPSIHPSGKPYRWLIPPNVELPLIDLVAAGFLPCYIDSRENIEGRDSRENIRQQRQLRTLSEGQIGNLTDSFHAAIEEAISRTQPTGPAQRHKRLFELVRELKAIASLADAPLRELKPIVRRWHARAIEQIQTKPFEESWFDFAEGWGKVKFAKGEGPIAMLFEKAKRGELPEAAKEYEQESLQDLVALCRELQRAGGNDPFYLATRTAGDLLGVTHMTAWRWLKGLETDGILECVQAGSLAKHRASRFRYLQPL